MNHGKPTYKKDSQVNGLTPIIYFYDDRDGPAASGWWLGPTVGGNEVWGFHPNTSAPAPPTTGWRVPHSGPVDPTFAITFQGGAGSPGGKGGVGGWGQQDGGKAGMGKG